MQLVLCSSGSHPEALADVCWWSMGPCCATGCCERLPASVQWAMTSGVIRQVCYKLVNVSVGYLQLGQQQQPWRTCSIGTLLAF